jgi:hypothetical protein
MSRLWTVLAIAVLLTFGASGAFAQATSPKATKLAAKTTTTQMGAAPTTPTQAPTQAPEAKETKAKAKKAKAKKAKKTTSESPETKRPQ